MKHLIIALLVLCALPIYGDDDQKKSEEDKAQRGYLANNFYYAAIEYAQEVLSSITQDQTPMLCFKWGKYRMQLSIATVGSNSIRVATKINPGVFVDLSELDQFIDFVDEYCGSNKKFKDAEKQTFYVASLDRAALKQLLVEVIHRAGHIYKKHLHKFSENKDDARLKNNIDQYVKLKLLTENESNIIFSPLED